MARKATGLANRIVLGDCLKELRRLPGACVDLAFADPPFNIGYEYDEYDDRKSAQEYLAWSRAWMTQVRRVLKPDGTFWLAIGDEYAAELKVLAVNELGFTCRSWVIWYYTFGVHCKNKFTRSHAHLFYFVVDPNCFTFADSHIRVPSARQLVYADRRADSRGRLPDDTWIIRPVPDESWILRPQDLPQGFSADSDTWYFPRVCGTFKERGGFHGCQMPEQLLGRITLACSSEQALVLDPFAGTGTTLAVAKKLGRRYLGIELSRQYATQARRRLRRVKRGESLAGSAKPIESAPKTSEGVMLTADGKRSKVVLDAAGQPRRQASRVRALTDVERGILQAFARTHEGWSTDRVIADPDINRRFIEACLDLSLPGRALDWNLALLRLRKGKYLSQLRPMRATNLARQDLDLCEFGSESALAVLTTECRCTLDRLLCDPDRANVFDQTARRFAPGWSPLYYRWAALRIRKRRLEIATAGEKVEPPFRVPRFEVHSRLDALVPERLDDKRAVYLLTILNEPLYVGATCNLRGRIQAHQRVESEEAIVFELPKDLESVNGWFAGKRGMERVFGLQARYIDTMEPRFNYLDLGRPKIATPRFERAAVGSR